MRTSPRRTWASERGGTPVSHRAFTLIELLAVVSLLGIIAVLAGGAFARQARRSPLTVLEERLRLADRDLRLAACRDGALSVVHEGSRLRIAGTDRTWDLVPDM